MSLWIGQMEPYPGSINRFFLSPGQSVELVVTCQIYGGGRTIESGHENVFQVELWSDLEDGSFQAIPMQFTGQRELYYEYAGRLSISRCGVFRYTVRFSPDGGKTWIYQNDFYQGDKLCLDGFVAVSPAWIPEATMVGTTQAELDSGKLEKLASIGVDVLSLYEPVAFDEELRTLTREAHALGMKVVAGFSLGRPPSDHPALKDPACQHWLRRESFTGSLYWNYGYYSDAEDWIEEGSYDPKLWEYLCEQVVSRVADYGLDGISCNVDGVPLRFWQRVVNAIRAVRQDALLIGRGADEPLLLRVFDVIDGKLASALRGFPSGRDIKHFFLGRDSRFPKLTWPLQYVESPEARLSAAVQWGSGETAFLRYAIGALTPGMPLMHLGQEGELADFYAHLLDIRKRMPVLLRGKTYFLNMEPEQDSLFTTLRYTSDQAVLIAVNLDPFYPQKATFRLPIWELGLDPDVVYAVKDIWAGTQPTLYSGQHLSTGIELSLPPNGLFIGTLGDHA